MIIKILGTGCPNCHTLEQRVKRVVEKNQIDSKIILVQDIMDIMAYNIMSTPALVVDEVIKVKGRVPSENEIIEILNLS